MSNCTPWSPPFTETSHMTECVPGDAVNISNTSSEEELYVVPAGIIVLLSFFYGSISFLAVVGNSLVMWIIFTSTKMHNVTNGFIANLALADIIIGLFAIPFQFQAALLQRWNLPHFMCAFCPFVQILSVNVSVFTLTAIAVDRHRAILNPLSTRPTKLQAKLIIAGIWTVAFILATPIMAAFRVYQMEYSIGGRNYTKPFCWNVTLSDTVMTSYRVVLILVQYVTPLCVITCVYTRMALKLWGSKAPGNAQDSRDANLMRNKKKVIKMLVIVVALFAICWLPLQTYNVLQDFFPEINNYRYINIIWFCCDWLAMSNSCYNPFIYGIYNEKFKREFKQRFPFRARPWSHSPPTESYDLDKSMRSSFYGTNDWRRSYSIRNHQNNINYSSNKNHKSFYREVTVREPMRRYQTCNNDLGKVTTELLVLPDSTKNNAKNILTESEMCL